MFIYLYFFYISSLFLLLYETCNACAVTRVEIGVSNNSSITRIVQFNNKKLIVMLFYVLPIKLGFRCEIISLWIVCCYDILHLLYKQIFHKEKLNNLKLEFRSIESFINLLRCWLSAYRSIIVYVFIFIIFGQ